MAWIVAVFAALAAVASHVSTIRDVLYKIVPSLAPFEAKLALRDFLATKASTDGTRVTLAVDYVVEKTGASALANCRAELLLPKRYRSSTLLNGTGLLSEQITGSFPDQFIIEIQDYDKEGLARIHCDKTVSNSATFKLPGIASTLTPATAQTKTDSVFYACVGEYQRGCGNTANWLPCGTDLVAWAKRTHSTQCASVHLEQLSSVSGNKCGYATFAVKCARN